MKFVPSPSQAVFGAGNRIYDRTYVASEKAARFIEDTDDSHSDTILAARTNTKKTLLIEAVVVHVLFGIDPMVKGDIYVGTELERLNPRRE